jgi:hypothetical protein
VSDKLKFVPLERGVVLDFPKKKKVTQDFLLHRIMDAMKVLDDDHHAQFSNMYNEFIKWHHHEIPKAPKNTKPPAGSPTAA